MSTTATRPMAVRAQASRDTGTREKPSFLSTGILILGALYCLFPVFWVLAAASKDGTELFSTFTLAPSTHLWDNIVELTAYRDGLFWRWMLNTALYAGIGAVVSTWVSALSGYVLAKFDFPGKNGIFKVLLMGVLVPGVILAIPQYLMLAQAGLTNTYWSVLLPRSSAPTASTLPGSTPPRRSPATSSRPPAPRAPGNAHLQPDRHTHDAARPGHHFPVPVRRHLEQLHAALHHARR